MAVKVETQALALTLLRLAAAAGELGLILALVAMAVLEAGLHLELSRVVLERLLRGLMAAALVAMLVLAVAVRVRLELMTQEPQAATAA